MKGTSELADKLEQLEEKATGAPWYDEMGIIVDNPDEMKGRRVLQRAWLEECKAKGETLTHVRVFKKAKKRA